MLENWEPLQSKEINKNALGKKIDNKIDNKKIDNKNNTLKH